MVRDDFWFRAPFQEERGSKTEYFDGAERKTHFIRAFRILHQCGDRNDVSTIYKLDIETPKGLGNNDHKRMA